MKDQVVAKGKVRKLITIILVILVLLFVAFQFVYISGVFIGALGGIMLGMVAVIKMLSFFESFVSAFGLLVFLMSIALIFLTKNTVVRSISFNVGFVFLAICIFETYLYLQQKSNPIAVALSQVTVDVPTTFWSTNKYLGVTPTPNTSSHVTSSYGDELLYDVTYTIDENSQRVSPGYVGGADGNSIMFLGCSVTFGYGLEDDETFPYLVGKKLDNQYKIYNFSFAGYGTHHVLSQIEHGLVEDVVEIKPKYAIYTAIPDHLRRIVGSANWGSNDPKYVLKEGKLLYKGLFTERTSVIDDIPREIRESHTVNALFGEVIENSRITFFTKMVETSRDKLKAIYPDCKFIVLFLEDGEKSLCDKMIASLQNSEIKVHRVSDMIPDFLEKKEQYQIRFPIESHPNFLTNDCVSDYVVSEIVTSD